jgi:translation initiation factor 1
MAKRPSPPAPPPGPFNAALAGLADRLGQLPPAAEPARRPAEPEARPAEVAPPPRPAGPAPPPRAVVRMERAGRGGKTVTVVEKLELRPRELEAWLGELKRALGCGGVVERGALVLQGDTRERVGAWLTRRGVKKVTVA